MKERPILMSAPMVVALLRKANPKTQTRRGLKGDFMYRLDGATDAKWYFRGAKQSCWDSYETAAELVAHHCPYGQPGDQLWVREAWSHDAESLDQCRASHEDIMGGGFHGPYYRATEVAPDTLRWKPSIRMPRWASRITLEITGVRVERLQNISEAEAIAEGASLSEGGHCPEPEFQSHTLGFWRLWDSINGPSSWASNPWVWVIEFKRTSA